MALHDQVARMRAERLQTAPQAVPSSFQGVTKEKVRQVLTRLHLGTNVDLVDGVYALLDDQTNSWFSNVPPATRFSHGATTAHLACHIGILQRGGGKLDREGRDYWIKPLRELGGIEPVLLHEQRFIFGHVKAKSPNSSYRLSEEFKAILRAPDGQWEGLLSAWTSLDAARVRREFQASMVEASRLLVDRGHSELIQASISYYAARFLPGYNVIYVDDGDGDRITEEDRANFARAGVHLLLGDAMPDVLLHNPELDWLWVIEAVTSDGEVDMHKMTQLIGMANRCGKAGIGFTTTYRTWREAGARQAAHGNVAVDSYIWIQEDPARHLLVESFPTGL
ncbi:BsuBI/PstI family type II restriction endonuclease [Paraburkholderia bryophila]|uniref:BsuBI/PstI restriction endonuclease domain-containing protein n=1 Tax=Paraburkholderia bryophila TaxID=420952 RepID=A0A7Z0B759_9BURK|nr:BsuBI/PstI family type II restriction endonuclease [Paraburkholderia bryophila]NYH22460.1 hypothetical protein [Paraburkholderia bryophila]